MRCLFWVPENDVATLLQHDTAAGWMWICAIGQPSSIDHENSIAKTYQTVWVN
jgi:hypothetical protein